MGNLKLYAVGTLPPCFEDTYKFLLKTYLKETKGFDVDVDDYTNTFKIDGKLYFEDFLDGDAQNNRFNIRLNSLGVPYINNNIKFHWLTENSCNLTRLVKYKTQFYNFTTDIFKPETNRLFYDSAKDDFFVVDCTVKEIENFYTNLTAVGVKCIDILDKSNNVMSVKISDVLKFCKKELDVISTENNLYHKDLRFYERLSLIFFSEQKKDFLKIYTEGLR